ncbi:MAG: TonB-dependent receptor [Pseudomonadales bacterium]|nr:TonB-dependent receptor [Pseudomonadales bacterium]
MMRPIHDKPGRVRRLLSPGTLRASLVTPLALLGFAGTHSVLAAESTSATGTLDTITVTASRIEQPHFDQSSSVSVVNRDTIDMVSAVHVSELLTRVPGVWVTRNNGQEHLTAIRSPVLTGAGSCGAFFVAEHGVPVRPTGFCNVNQLFDINTEQAGRIEVLRGPGTALHSSDAVHGVINVISEAPAAQWEVRVAAEAGPNDYGRVKLSLSDSADHHGYRINFNGASDGGYQDDSGFDQQKLNARFDYEGRQWSSFSLLSASNLNQETAGYVAGTDAYKDEDLRESNPNPEAYRDSQSLRWQTHFERQLANEDLLLITPYARHSRMEFLMHFLPGQPVEENGQNSLGLQTSYLTSPHPDLVLTQGLDLELTDAVLKQTQESPFLWFTPEGKQYDYEVQARLLAGFVTADYQWTEPMTLSAGLRFETLKYDYDNRMLSGNTDADGNPCVNTNTGATGCRYTRPEDRSDGFENLSANLGLVYRHSAAVIGSARLSHGFRAPQATELYRLQQGQLIANLDSEEINGVELGLKGQLQQASYELVAYYMKKNNVIFQSSERLNLDNGQTRHYGLEYELFWQWAAHWDVGASGSFAHHRYASNVSSPGASASLQTEGNEIVSAPHRMGSVELGWVPQANTRVALQWVTMGKYYTDLENNYSYPGHDLLHLRLRHQVNPSLELGLRIQNLTDRDYAERADYSAFAGERYFVGQPRSLYADAEFRF